MIITPPSGEESVVISYGILIANLIFIPLSRKFYSKNKSRYIPALFFYFIKIPGTALGRQTFIVCRI